MENLFPGGRRRSTYALKHEIWLPLLQDLRMQSYKCSWSCNYPVTAVDSVTFFGSEVHKLTIHSSGISDLLTSIELYLQRVTSRTYIVRSRVKWKVLGLLIPFFMWISSNSSFVFTKHLWGFDHFLSSSKNILVLLFRLFQHPGAKMNIIYEISNISFGFSGQSSQVFLGKEHHYYRNARRKIISRADTTIDPEEEGR